MRIPTVFLVTFLVGAFALGFHAGRWRGERWGYTLGYYDANHYWSDYLDRTIPPEQRIRFPYAVPADR